MNGTAYSVPSSSISGTILEPNGVTVPMSFLSVGTGLYQYIYAVPQLPGTYTATVTVTYDGLTAQAAASFYVLTLKKDVGENITVIIDSTGLNGSKWLANLKMERKEEVMDKVSRGNR